MNRRYVLLCLACAAAGLGIGRYVWTAPVSGAPALVSSRQPSAKAPSTQNVPQAVADERSVLRRAALILAMAARNERNKLPALIAACQHDDAALQLLADTWLHIDPGAFARALASFEAMEASRWESLHSVLTVFVSRWGEKDPDAAWSAVTDLPRSLSRFLQAQLALNRIERNPKAGLEFMLSHPGIVVPFFNKELTNGAELLPLIRRLPDCAGKNNLMAKALKGLPLAEAMAALGDVTEYSTASVRGAIFHHAVKKDVEEVIAWHANATGQVRNAAAQFIGGALVTKDPARALDWAKQHLSGNPRTVTIRRAAEALESIDPAAAAAARGLLPESFKPKAPRK